MFSHVSPVENLKPFDLRCSQCLCYSLCPPLPTVVLVKECTILVLLDLSLFQTGVRLLHIYILLLILESSCRKGSWRKQIAEQHVGGMGFTGNEYVTTFISHRNNYFLQWIEQEIIPFPALYGSWDGLKLFWLQSLFVLIEFTLRKNSCSWNGA